MYWLSSWAITLTPAALIASLAGVLAASENSGLAVAAVIAGAFMLVNTTLTIWLTNRLTRRKNHETSHRRNHGR